MIAEQPVSPLDRIPPHVVERDLLAPEDHLALRRWALDRAGAMVPSLIGPKGKAALRPQFRNSLTLPKAELEPWLPMLRERIGARLPALCAALGVAARDVGKMEFEAVIYRDGAFYRRHIDTQRSSNPANRLKPRILSCVYYFHSEPRGFEGGALRLYSFSAGGSHLDIDPQANALLVFPSFAPHEVMPVRCPSDDLEHARLAINCWIHRVADQ